MTRICAHIPCMPLNILMQFLLSNNNQKHLSYLLASSRIYIVLCDRYYSTYRDTPAAIYPIEKKKKKM